MFGQAQPVREALESNIEIRERFGLLPNFFRLSPEMPQITATLGQSFRSFWSICVAVSRSHSMCARHAASGVTLTGSTPASLHHHLPSHLRVDRAEIGIRSRLCKCVRERFVRIPYLGLERAVCAHHRMGNIITVSPRNCSSDRCLDRLRPKTEIIDF